MLDREAFNQEIETEKKDAAELARIRNVVNRVLQDHNLFGDTEEVVE